MEERNNIEGLMQVMQEILGRENIDPITKEDADALYAEIFNQRRLGTDGLEILRFLYGLDGRKKLSETELLDLTGLDEKDIQEAKKDLRECVERSFKDFIELMAKSKKELARKIISVEIEKRNDHWCLTNWEYEARKLRDLINKLIASPDILIMDVKDMPISNGLVNILRRNGIVNVAQILSKNGCEIHDLRGVGRTKYKELQIAVEALLNNSFPIHGYWR